MSGIIKPHQSDEQTSVHWGQLCILHTDPLHVSAVFLLKSFHRSLRLLPAHSPKCLWSWLPTAGPMYSLLALHAFFGCPLLHPTPESPATLLPLTTATAAHKQLQVPSAWPMKHNGSTRQPWHQSCWCDFLRTPLITPHSAAARAATHSLLSFAIALAAAGDNAKDDQIWWQIWEFLEEEFRF